MDFYFIPDINPAVGRHRLRVPVRLLPAIAALWAFFITPVLQAAVVPPPPPPATIRLAWDPSPSTEVTAYNVYFGTASRAYGQAKNVGPATECVITNLTRGVAYYFAATALNQGGLESDFSEELIFVAPVVPQLAIDKQPGGPATIAALGIQGYTYEVLASEDLNSWVNIATVTANSIGEIQFTDTAAGFFKRRFYRLRQIYP